MIKIDIFELDGLNEYDDCIYNLISDESINIDMIDDAFHKMINMNGINSYISCFYKASPLCMGITQRILLYKKTSEFEELHDYNFINLSNQMTYIYGEDNYLEITKLSNGYVIHYYNDIHKFYHYNDIVDVYDFILNLN